MSVPICEARQRALELTSQIQNETGVLLYRQRSSQITDFVLPTIEMMIRCSTSLLLL